MTNSNFFHDHIDFKGEPADQETMLNHLKNELEQQIQSLEKAILEHQQIQEEKQALLETFKAQLLQTKDSQEICNLETNIKKIKSFLEDKNSEYMQRDSHNLMVRLKQQLKKLNAL